jgi:hypothetical protein
MHSDQNYAVHRLRPAHVVGPQDLRLVEAVHSDRIHCNGSTFPALTLTQEPRLARLLSPYRPFMQLEHVWP